MEKFYLPPPGNDPLYKSDLQAGRARIRPIPWRTKVYLEEKNFEGSWRVSPSRIAGYYRNYYAITPEGDEISVDFNFPRQMVRISLKREEERGREYVAVIKSGTILQEKDLAGRRALDLTSRIYPLRKYFALLHDATLLKAIGGIYNIPTQPLHLVQNDGRYSYADRFPMVRDQNLLQWIRDHLARKRELENREAPAYIRLIRRLPDELLDISLGMLLIIAYLQNYLSLTELAGFAGFWGIFSGAMDWVWRQRDPFLPKVVLMLAVSGGAVYYQIQNRIWGIFL